MRTTILLAAVFLLPSKMFCQKQNNPDKIRTIKADPATYVKQGGVLDDRLIQLPEKKKGDIVTPDFIIHTNANQSTSAKSDAVAHPHKDFQRGNTTSDQSSDEYMMKKDLWIQQNKELYEQKTRSTETRESRNKVSNKK